MARKKIAGREVKDQHVESRLPSPTEDALENLRNLNSILLKETAEKRHLVDYLRNHNVSLQSDLARAESERAELTRAFDSVARIELEKSVEAEFLRVQMEKREGEARREYNTLMFQYNDLLKENEEKEEMLQAVMSDREMKERSLFESNREIHILNQKIVEIVREKEASEEEVFTLHNVVDKLRENVSEMEKKCKESIHKGTEMKKKMSELMEGKIEGEHTISMLLKDKGSIESKLADAYNQISEKNLSFEKMALEKRKMKDANVKLQNQVAELKDSISGLEESSKVQEQVIAKLKTELGTATLEKEGTQKELDEEQKNGLMMKERIHEMESHIGELASELAKTKADYAKKMVLEKRKLEDANVRGEVEIVKLQNQVTELKDSISGFEESSKVQEQEIAKLKTELGTATLEKEGTQKELDEEQKNGLMMKEKIHEMENHIGELASELAKTKADYAKKMALEKRKLEDANVRAEVEIVKLQNQVTELKDSISGLEESSKVQEQVIAKLKNEVGTATLEKEGTQKELDEEQKNGLMMKEKIHEMESHIGELATELDKTKADYAKNVAGEKKKFEIDILYVKAQLAEAQTKLQLANANLEEVLNMLKVTSLSVGSKDESQMLLGEEIEPHVSQWEAIKKGIKIRENRIEDMKQEVESLKNSVTQANKKKSVWTIISSATTLIVGISLAYVARSH